MSIGNISFRKKEFLKKRTKTNERKKEMAFPFTHLKQFIHHVYYVNTYC